MVITTFVLLDPVTLVYNANKWLCSVWSLTWEPRFRVVFASHLRTQYFLVIHSPS